MNFKINAFSRDVADEDLLQDLVATEANLKTKGKALTFRSYRSLGKYSPQTIVARFGSWNEGLRRANLALNEEKNIPVDFLFDNLKVIWISKGKQPVYRDMNVSPSQCSASTYLARFGGWRRALEEFVASVDKKHGELLRSDIEVRSDKTKKRTKRDPSLSLRFLVLKRDHFRCVACGRSPATVAGLVLEVDHVVAWSNDGETVEENLQSLCIDWNRGKGAT